MSIELVALTGGLGLLVLLIVLAGVVQWRRDPGEGTSGFVIFVGIVVVFTVAALFKRFLVEL